MSLGAPAKVGPSAHEHGKHFLQLLGWLLLAGSLLYVFPAAPEVARGLDESWKAFLSFAFLAGKHFGTEVVFTYGPWGFLIYPRNFPGMFPWVVLGRLVLVSGCSVGLALLGVRWIQKPIPRWSWAMAILLIAEPTYLLTPLLFLLLWREPARRGTWERLSLHAVAVAAGLAANTKFTCLILLAVLVAALLVRREGRWLSVTAVVSGLGFWILAGQPLTGLPAFLSNSGALATGYHAAMSTWQPSQAAIWGGLLLCGLPALAVLAAELRRPSFSSVALCGWFLLFEAIVVQQAMARSDRFHLTMGLVSAAWPVALTLLPCPHLWTFATPRHYQKLFALTILLAGCYVCFSILTQPNQQGQLTQTPGMSTEWWNIPRPRAATSAQVSAETVAVFPMDLSYAFQKGYAVRNLPVIQSYAAFSPRLTALNSHFLESDSAPARIYFEVAPIDYRYPTLEDPLTWRSLLTHYQPAAMEDDFLVLHRRARPRRFKCSLILSRRIRLGEPVTIPSRLYPIIWAEVRTETRSTAYLLKKILPVQKLVMNVQTPSRKGSFAFLEEVAGAGFLLSPYIDSPAAMSAIYSASSPADPGEPVQSVSFTQPGITSRLLPQEVHVRLYAFSFSPQDAPPADDQALRQAQGESR